MTNELRKGNLVHIDDFSNYYTVTEIREKYIRVSYIREDTKTPHVSFVENERVIGISITEGLLVRFGFKRDELNGRYYPTWRKFIPIYNRGHYYNFNGISLNCKDFEYVHQLQNLYFALTGEELTWEEKK